MCLDPSDTEHPSWAVFQARRGVGRRLRAGCWTGRWLSLHCHSEKKKNGGLMRPSRLSGINRTIWEWRKRALLKEMVELGDAARRPLEAAVSVSQVAHDVTVFPATTLSTGATQVTRWRWTVVNGAQSNREARQKESVGSVDEQIMNEIMLPLSSDRHNYLQMADFVSGDDDAGEPASVLDDGYAVDFLKTLVNDTGSSDVGKSCCGITQSWRSILIASTQEEQKRMAENVVEEKDRETKKLWCRC